MSNEQEREAFYKWAESYGFDLRPTLAGESSVVAAARKGWFARAALDTPKLPSGDLVEQAAERIELAWEDLKRTQRKEDFEDWSLRRSFSRKLAEAALTQASNWQNIETAPKSGEVLFAKIGGTPALISWQNDKWYFMDKRHDVLLNEVNFIPCPIEPEKYLPQPPQQREGI